MTEYKLRCESDSRTESQIEGLLANPSDEGIHIHVDDLAWLCRLTPYASPTTYLSLMKSRGYRLSGVLESRERREEELEARLLPFDCRSNFRFVWAT